MLWISSRRTATPSPRRGQARIDEEQHHNPHQRHLLVLQQSEALPYAPSHQDDKIIMSGGSARGRGPRGRRPTVVMTATTTVSAAVVAPATRRKRRMIAASARLPLLLQIIYIIVVLHHSSSSGGFVVHAFVVTTTISSSRTTRRGPEAGPLLSPRWIRADPRRGGIIFDDKGGRTARSTSSSTARHVVTAAAATAAAATTTTSSSSTMAASTAVAGKVWPLLRKLFMLFHPHELVKVIRGIQTHLQPQDWIFLLVLGIIGYCHVFETNKRSGRRRHQDEDDSDATSSRTRRLLLVSPLLKRVAVIQAVQELAQVAVASYAVDILCLALRLQGVHFPHLWDVPRVFAKSSFTLWALRQFLRRKRDALKSWLGSGYRGASTATIDLVDRAVNVISIALTGLLISDWVSVELGLAFKGVVTLGSLGTLAFTLASKDLASQIVSGMFLQAGNKMRNGEKVALGSSTGKVVKIGLTETVLRASDNTITSIPNAKVSQDKVINYSRVPVSQVAQKLRFHMEDIDVLPDVLESIRREIKSSCPQLIVDGSRPFRVFFTDYAENCLEVMIDTHFNISPTSDEYWVNRQEVLMAINRAVKSHRIQYAYSTSTPTTSAPPTQAVSDPSRIGGSSADGPYAWESSGDPVQAAAAAAATSLNGDDPSRYVNGTTVPRAS